MKTTTSDFFANQARATRHTTWLVFLFFVAVILIIIGLYIAVAAVLAVFLGTQTHQDPTALVMSPKLFAVVAGGALLVILGGTIFKMIALRQGGSAVALLLGAVPVPLDTTDHDERKFLNVVDEMSLASGCPPPSVFILRKEHGINAFAAGFSQTDAAICVTEGAIRLLDRSELQGVVAHEFSHIVNGDMALNIRLMGVLYGILQISLLGSALMYLAMSGDNRSRRSRNDNEGGAVVFLLVLGLVLFVVGYVGVFFGRLIKSGVSRQREFLADAAAVQYTRYPGGLAGALKKIGGYTRGSRIGASHAEEVSHFFFSDSAGGLLNLGGLLSTHPPLPVRIRRIDPTFDGDFPQLSDAEFPTLEEVQKRVAEKEARSPRPAGPPPVSRPLPGPLGQVLPPGVLPSGMSPAAAIPASIVLSHVGAVKSESLNYARGVLDSIPEDLRAMTRTAEGSRAIALAVVLGEDEQLQGGGEEARRTLVPSNLGALVRSVGPYVWASDRMKRMALLDLCLPALRQQPAGDRLSFMGIVRGVIAADRRTTLFEFLYERILARHLDDAVRAQSAKGIQFYALRPLLPDAAVLLSGLSHVGSKNREEAEAAFAAGVSAFGKEGISLTLLPPDACGTATLTRSFDKFACSAPQMKRQLLDACLRAVSSDNVVTWSEQALLRVIAEALDLPLPPIISSH